MENQIKQTMQFLNDHWQLGLPCPKCGHSDVDDNVAIGMCKHRLSKITYKVAIWACCNEVRIIQTLSNVKSA